MEAWSWYPVPMKLTNKWCLKSYMTKIMNQQKQVGALVEQTAIHECVVRHTNHNCIYHVVPAEILEYAKWLGMDIENEQVRESESRHRPGPRCLSKDNVAAGTAVDRQGRLEGARTRGVEALVSAKNPPINV